MTHRSRPHAVRAAALVGAAVLAASALALLGPAQAADPEGAIEVAVAAVDTDSDGTTGLVRFDTPDGARAGLPGAQDSGDFDAGELTSARNGGRTVAVEAALATGMVRIVVRDISGVAVRVPVAVPFDSPLLVSEPALSPDGTTVVWSQLDLRALDAGDLDRVFTLRRAAITGGAAVTVPGSSGLISPTFATSGLLVALDLLSPGSTYATIPVAGGATRPVVGPGYDDTVSQLTFNGTGNVVALARDTTPAGDPDGPGTSDIEVATAAVSGTRLTLGLPDTVATGLQNDSPAFSRDDQDVLFVRYDGLDGPGDLWTVPADGNGDPVVLDATEDDEYAVAVGVRDQAAPAAPTSVGPATLAGTTASIPFVLAADPTLSRTTVVRTAPGTAAKSFSLLNPLRVLSDTGLVLGKTYTYAFRGVDFSGNTGEATTRSLVATAQPGLVFTDPTSTGSASAPFRVTLAAPGNVTGTGYVVRYRANGGALFPFVTGSTATSAVFGGPAAAGVIKTTSNPGVTYAFVGQARDQFGNLTAAKTSGRAVVPLDQTRAAYRGSVITAARAGSYLTTATLLRTGGSTATISLTGDRLQVIGERCTTCGAFDVLVNGVKVATVDSYARTRQVKQVLFGRAFPTARTSNVVIRAVGTAGRPAIVLDGFAVRK